MINARLKYWPLLFLATIVEGIIALVWLRLIPPDAKSSILLIFSLKRLLMMAFIIVIMAASALIGWLSWRRQDWREKWLNPDHRPGLFRSLTIIILIIPFALEITLLFLRNYDPARLTPLFIRSAPILGYLFLICAQTAIWLHVLRIGHGLNLFWCQSILWIFGSAISVRHSHLITVKAYDSYGLSVGRVIYPASNELKSRFRNMLGLLRQWTGLAAGF